MPSGGKQIFADSLRDRRLLVDGLPTVQSDAHTRIQRDYKDNYACPNTNVGAYLSSGTGTLQLAVTDLFLYLVIMSFNGLLNLGSYRTCEVHVDHLTERLSGLVAYLVRQWVCYLGHAPADRYNGSTPKTAPSGPTNQY